MTLDPIRAGRELSRAGKKDSHLWAVILCCLYAVASCMGYLRQFTYANSDFYLHAAIAADFDFTDLHSITSRIAYPLWHVLVASLCFS